MKSIDLSLYLLYNICDGMSTLKIRQKVGKSDLNAIINENFSVTRAGLFQSEGEWIHPTRSLDEFEIIYVTEGEVFMEEEERRIEARKGELFILRPDVTHRGSKVSMGVSFYWVHFKIKGGLPFKSLFFDSFEDSYLFKELLHEFYLPSHPEYLINGVFAHILGKLCQLSEENAGSFDGTAEKIYQWIRMNAFADLTVAAVAEKFNYSPDHLSRICKAHFKENAGEMIDRFLMLRAKELLSHTGKYVKEIAADLRFKDDKSFIGYFKYHEGVSPTEFRRRYGKIFMNNR